VRWAGHIASMGSDNECFAGEIPLKICDWNIGEKIAG
jgi:hypothetical protein